MKKILIASTALVALAGVASAEVSLSGGANFGMKYDDSKKNNKATIHNELDFNLSGSGESDNGIKFGASVDFDADMNDQTESSYQAGKSADPEAFISFNGVTLTVGAVSAGDDIGGIADVGYDGIGIDAENSALGDHDVNVKYETGNLTFMASYGSNTEDYGVGVEGSFNQMSFALGHSRDNSAKQEVTHLTLGYAFNAVKTNVYVEQLSTKGAKDQTNYGLDVSYTANDLTVTFAAMAGDFQKDTNYGIGASYDLGGGLAIAGGIGSVQDTATKTKTVADLGVTMKF